MGSSNPPTKGSRRRIQILAVGALLVFAVLAVRATWLGTVRASSLSAKADRQHLIAVSLPAQRGAIVSADGRMLAVDVPSFLVTADARYVGDPEKVADTVASVTRGDASRRDQMEKDLRSKKPYVILAKHASPKQADYLRELDLDGVHFARTARRSYPLQKVAGQLVGFTNLETGAGIEGLEAKQNVALAGTPGERVEVRDPKLGQTVRIEDALNPVAGKSVELTVNAAIQKKLELEMAAARIKYSAKSATGVIMDPQTGAILAMATVPRVDPNDREGLKPENTQNRAITDPYEPGSVFKAFTVAGALEEGLTTPTEKWVLPPKLTFLKDQEGEFTIQEAHERHHTETMTTTEILQRSSNIGTIKVADRLRVRNKLRLWMARFGFGKRTGVDLAGEDAGSLLPVAKWSLGSRVNIPFGQGMTATQLQLVRAYAAFANGGYLVTPHVVARIGGASVAPTGARQQVISRRTALQVTRMLERVVEGTDGTGVEASLENYSVAGKTGTAEKVDPKLGRYVDRYRSSFIGFVPSNKPSLVIAVMIDDPDPLGPYTGGEVAAPVFKEVADYALTTLGIPPK